MAFCSRTSDAYPTDSAHDVMSSHDTCKVHLIQQRWALAKEDSSADAVDVHGIPAGRQIVDELARPLRAKLCFPQR